MEELGVRLLNEGTDVWAMVPAQNVRANIYVILENSVEAEQDCELEFHAGDLVTTLDRTSPDGQTFLAAQRLYAI